LVIKNDFIKKREEKKSEQNKKTKESEHKIIKTKTKTFKHVRKIKVAKSYLVGMSIVVVVVKDEILSN